LEWGLYQGSYIGGGRTISRDEIIYEAAQKKKKKKGGSRPNHYELDLKTVGYPALTKERSNKEEGRSYSPSPKKGGGMRNEEKGRVCGAQSVFKRLI